MIAQDHMLKFQRRTNLREGGKREPRRRGYMILLSLGASIVGGSLALMITFFTP